MAHAGVMSWGIPLICFGTATGWAAGRLLAAGPRPAPVPVGWCAAATGVLWGAVWALRRDGALPGWWLPVPLAATAFAVPLATADILHRRVPDVLTLPAYGIGVVAVGAAASGGPGPPLAITAVVGGAATLGAHLFVRALAPASLGAGDVKLSGSLGLLAAAAGWPTLVVSMVFASLVTAVLAGAAALMRSARWRDGVPHGPGLLAATCVGVLFPGGLPPVGG